jgi:hypothetical protein
MLDDEEGMQAMQCLSHPMDLLTMLYKVRSSVRRHALLLTVNFTYS